MAQTDLKKPDEKKAQFTAQFKEFVNQKLLSDVIKASQTKSVFAVNYQDLDRHSPEMAELLLDQPEYFFEIANDAMKEIEVVQGVELPSATKARFFNLPESVIVSIRDLRARHIGKFIAVEGVVRKASEIRPEIVAITWECPDCGGEIEMERSGNFVSRPFSCPTCSAKGGFKQKKKKMVDMRWIMIEEPFELTEGEKPSQVNLVLTGDLTSPDFRRQTDPGNRLLLSGILKDIPKGKSWNVKLDFYLDVNHIEAKETGWERVNVTPEDEALIRAMAADPEIYSKLVASLAPSLYGMEPIKEAIILQLFGGVGRTLPDKTKSRGDIHVLLIGDPASGKSQLLKLVPQIVPRGKYVSGKGTTAAGLTASVSKDEQFMGGWVLEAGAMVLAHKGLLSVDEFEKMSVEDQVAMHEALEQGSVSIAKAAIVATLPAQTSVLAGGNPKFSRFDPYMAIAKQITIPETLLSRFDLKFALRDIPDAERDRRVVDHVLSSRHDSYEAIIPKIPAEIIRKYVAFTKYKIKPVLTDEAGQILRNFYLTTRKKAEGGGAMSITMRQFEALIRLSEASAKIQLSPEVRRQDAMRAIELMKVSLRQLGFDPDTGEIDVDRAEGGTTAHERSGIRLVMDIINQLAATKKEIPIAEIEEAARKQNVQNVDEVMEKLRKEGLLFEPSPGFVQKV